MNQAKFNEDVHSSFNNIFIEYMTDVEAHYLVAENTHYSKEVEDKIKNFRHTYNAKIKGRLSEYLDGVNGSPISDEQKEEARQTLYRNESVFNSEGVKLQLNILNRFRTSPE